ncbi:MAG TPA: hypothetical protein VKB69_04965, partial [Micromonosporaceae bacterium]|nr:hypothetical protein [Micromonosporaceae bacterium]
MDDIRTLLAEQVRDEPPASMISVTRAVADGRRVVQVRRVTFSVSAVLVVGLVAVSAVWFDQRGGGEPIGNPTHPASRSIRPSVVGLNNNGVPPSGWVVPPGGGPGPANVPVVSGIGDRGGPVVARMPGGGSVTLPTPSGSAIDDVVRVPGGWVFERGDDDQTQRSVIGVWYMPDGGTPRKAADGTGGFAVSEDGTVLLVAGLGSGPAAREMAAYELPSLSLIRQATFAVGDGLRPVVQSFHGDWALFTAAGGDSGTAAGELWNTATGAVVPFATRDGVRSIGVSADGRVLREIYPLGSPTMPTCIDLVTPGSVVPTGLTGFCSSDMPVADQAWLSPSGQWAVFHSPDGTEYVVTTSELDSGVDLHVSYLPPDASVLFWDTDNTFVAALRPGPDNAYYHCDQLGA